MCGILFCKWRNNRHLNNRILNESLSLLKRRGPDHSKLIIDKNWSIGHTRLSIIDPNSKKSNQPFTDKENRFYLTFNGEIYNFKELKQNLISRGFKFETNSDTEVLFILLKYFPIEGVLKLIRGMFAFVFFDKKKDTFIAARDHFGQKPLYFSITDNIIAISSNIKSLNKIVNSGPDLDIYNLYLSSNGIINKKKTFFKKIKFLQAGKYITGSKFGYKLNKYFEPVDLFEDKLNLIQKKNSLKDSEECLNYLIKKSISRHLVSDVDIGVLLSGGIDSSLLYYYALQQNKKITSFTSFSPQIENNTFNLVPKIIKKFPSKKNYYIFQKKRNYIHDLKNLIDDSHNPPRWGGGPPMSRLCKKARDCKIKVLIGGDGVDEISGGYNTMINLLKSKNLNKTSIHETLKLSKNRVISKNKYFYEFEKSMISEKMKILDKLKKTKNINDRIVNSLLIQDTTSFLQMCTLPHSDEYSMYNSIELRNPYLDLDLVKFIFNEPTEKKITKNTSKVLFKALSKKFLGKFIDKEKEGTRNYSRYISNPSFWNLKEFKLTEIIEIKKNYSELPLKLLYKIISLEIFHRSVVLKDKNFFKEIMSKKGIKEFNI